MPKKTGRKSTGTSRKKRSGAAKKNISVRRRERRNQNWAFVLLFVALMALLAVFGVKAPVIDFIRQSTKIIGAGFFVLPFSLILAAVILFVSPGGKAAFRVCARSYGLFCSAALFIRWPVQTSFHSRKPAFSICSITAV